MITGMHTTWCQVSDMDASTAFYRDVLGLTVGYQSPYWTELGLAPGKIALHHRLEDGADPLGETGKGWNLGMACDDLRGLRQKLVAQGVSEFGFHDVPYGAVLSFCDPDGNPIQAVQVGITAAELA